jgi:hypothetical protein
MDEYKRAIRAERRRRQGILAGLLGCIFAVLGIFTIGTLFVPIAVICSIVGLLRGVTGPSASGLSISLLGALLCAVGVMLSPALLLMLSGLFVATQTTSKVATRTTSVDATGRAPLIAGSMPVAQAQSQSVTTTDTNQNIVEGHPSVIRAFNAARNDLVVVALVNMSDVEDDPLCAEFIGPIKIEGIQFSKDGAALESFRFFDKNGAQWSVPTNIENLPSTPAQGWANSFIKVGKSYLAHVQACGSGGLSTLISLYDMSVRFGADLPKVGGHNN